MSAALSETPKQLTFACKLKDCGATLELRTHGRRDKDGIHRWMQISAEALVKAPKNRGMVGKVVRVSWAMADLDRCHLARWEYHDSVWIGNGGFDVDTAEGSKVERFFVSLGVDIQDHREAKGGTK